MCSLRRWGYIVVYGIALLRTICSTISAQSIQYHGYIGAVRTHVSGMSSYAVPQINKFRLGSDNHLEIDFDLLGNDTPILEYRIVHCNADWKPSVLQPIEYIIGFDSYELPAPEVSRNTLMPYVHYHMRLPNDHTNFKHSGNYLLEISYPEASTPILTIPFAVSEQSVLVNARMHPDSFFEIRGRYQQVDVDVELPKDVYRPEQELQVQVLQNGRWDNLVVLRQPFAATSHSVRYAEAQGAVFEAGHEYHKMEHISERAVGIGIQRSLLSDQGIYKVELAPHVSRAHGGYRYDEDHNGLEVIRTNTTDYPDIEADYHLVQFVLNMPYNRDGDIVLEGEAFRYMPLEKKTMQYDNVMNAYTLTVPLKMGYQEFLYLYRPYGATQLKTELVEGNYYQTSNSYSILVYRRSFHDKADRLISFIDL